MIASTTRNDGHGPLKPRTAGVGQVARGAAVLLGLAAAAASLRPAIVSATDARNDPKVRGVVNRGLEWLAANQSRRGSWAATGGKYPTAMTAMAGVALLCEGSTTTQGKYSPNIRAAVDYLVARSQPNGLIGDPYQDDRYIYGHGFSMLFLSQVLGEEEDTERRQQLVDVLRRAVVFSGRAQTKAGGWGYVSAEAGGGFDEGSTTITQIQGLRGCRNAGIPVPNEIIDKAIRYIDRCTLPEGGVQYNIQGGGPRPAITAAAVACLVNVGDYHKEIVDRLIPKLKRYCGRNLDNLAAEGFGHWHYAHYYFAQVSYRDGGKKWEDYRDRLYARLVQEAGSDGSWTQGYIGPVYTTSINLTILQLENAALPIYQR